MSEFLSKNDLEESAPCEPKFTVFIPPEYVNSDGSIKLPPMAGNLSTYAIDVPELKKVHRGLEVLYEQIKGLSEEVVLESSVKDRMLRRVLKATNALRACGA